MAQLASRVKLDAFTKVKKAIDDMIAQLLQQKADEIKKRDYCIDEMNTNERTTEMRNRDKDDLTAKIEDLENTILTLTKEIEGLKAEIAEMQEQLKQAGEDREKENKDFQQTVNDAGASVKLLVQALKVLKSVYKKSAAAFVQSGAGGDQAPPPGFKAYKKSGGGGGVVGMIEQIIGEAKGEAAEAIRDEEDAQEAYENFVKDTNKSIEEKDLENTNKSIEEKDLE